MVLRIPNPCAFVCCCGPRTGAKYVAILNMVLDGFVTFAIGFWLIIAKSGAGPGAGDYNYAFKPAMVSFVITAFDFATNAILLCAVYQKNTRECKIWIFIELFLSAIGFLQIILESVNSTPAEFETIQFGLRGKLIGSIIGVFILFYEIWIVLAYIDQVENEESSANFGFEGRGQGRYGSRTVPSLPGAAAYEIPTGFGSDYAYENERRSRKNEKIPGPPPPYEAVAGTGNGTNVPPA